LNQGPDPGEVLLVAEEDGVVVGYAMGGPCPEDPVYRGELGQFYVLPSRQGQGVGRALVREMVRHLAYQGIYSLHMGKCKKLT
jgi:ribosomal protein S18 acetylase RimI-like enzyme